MSRIPSSEKHPSVLLQLASNFALLRHLRWPLCATFLLLALTVWAFLTSVSTTPAADFCCRISVNYSTLSHESQTCSRSPAISSTAFDTRPPDLPPASLMGTDFAIIGSLVRRRRPQIRFLSIGPYLCSTLPSDPTSR